MAINQANALQKWKDNTGRSAESYKMGIQGVTDNPMQKAADAGDAYLAGVQRSEASGKRRRKLMAVSMEQWKQAAINKGAARISAGVTAAVPKMQAFMSQFFPYLQQGVDQVRAMPKGSLEQNIARMEAMVRHNANYRQS